ncbi:MAG: hypothetical protein ABIK28_03460 [Planctomycetota bacterium]
MRNILILLCVICMVSKVSAAEEPVFAMAEYLDFSRASADWIWENYDARIEEWKRNLDPENVFGYRPPSGILEMAVIYATLYETEGRTEYVDRAKKVLLSYDGYKEAYPEEARQRRPDYSDGVPALPDFFTTMRYIRACEVMIQHGLLNESETDQIEAVVGQSLDYLLRTQEWGTMNRAALRAETLAWAIRTFPDHRDIKNWKTYERALGQDNWGMWEIEDATIYHAVWLCAMLGYADARREMKALFQTPEMFYYSQYFLNLMSPDDMIPDFGDARWQDNWSRYLVFFEAAAAAYKDPRMKWAANRIAHRFLDLKNVQQIGLAYFLLDAFRYGTEDLVPEAPAELSMEVMEEVVGKKIVFRSGWDADSTYLLLNYRDEGDGGLLFRDYLRDTIPVEEEKMTHGHADENSLVMLMSNGSLLLHDGGYRDYMPSGPYGAYRQDYFHNRMCVRPEKIWMGQKEGEYRYSVDNHVAIPGQPVLDFLHNAGSYRSVRTQKVDFLSFEEFDYSRTRLIDDKLGYAWDRVLVYIKDPGIFVVFDVLKARTEAFFTACNLWHTRCIVSRGEHWYDTVYDEMQGRGLPQDTHLLIHFPKNHYRMESVEKEDRHYQEEWVIAETAAQCFELGQHIGLVTVLVPHGSKEDPAAWLERIRYEDSVPEGDGMCIEVNYEGRVIRTGIKQDLRMDMVRDWRRPKYTWESGRLAFGPLETNGDFFFTEVENQVLSYTVVNMTRVIYNGSELFRQRPSTFGLAFDGSRDQSGVGKVRYWRDELPCPKAGEDKQ